ncbi:MAG: hypothetical protein C4532_18210 [Candidatus Abyssobacteria bacterium SURF_17]|jgi:pyrimidine-specific ribonucleoside hydrolase|uniref:Inosine/uridine-preferring nucleoside hydrolase domain-containing protein n=1 Tax=Candidatus Abyssobacteria bacterium SURF_17 TaxID=2093361 RepID=A0A419EPS3_9BACT|nr:MAG: hypothetical protein C4532_18210 [Candidatus Abyssubacteria bacterium SURF_17]
MQTTKKTVLIALIVVMSLWPLGLAAHEERIPVIMDTDMALDDVRALSLLLCSQHVQVKAIVTSDGSSSPEAGYRNLLRVLTFMEATSVPVGVGRALDQPPPPWRERSEALGWAELPVTAHEGDIPDAISLIVTLLQKEKQPITYVCLGPMTNLADALRKEPSVRDRIQNIVFLGSPVTASEQGWNTMRDPEAVRAVSASGIPIYFFHLEEQRFPEFDSGLLEDIEKFSSNQSRLIGLTHRDERIQSLLREGHLRMWDETVALFLDDSSLGTVVPIEGEARHFILQSWDQEAARKAYLRLVSGWTEHDLYPRQPVVLNRYPTNPQDFQEDVRPFVPELITRNGLEEWKAVVLTNELHRHLGVYSILGAKMGIRARELLGASLDELRVESHAGIEPPLSCMNDGLQVSTGASLGRGTITILNGKPTPAVTFIHGDKSLHLRLKDEVIARIHADFKNAIDTRGALTSEYFKEVRRLSLDYWMNADRRDIFDQQIEVLK